MAASPLPPAAESKYFAKKPWQTGFVTISSLRHHFPINEHFSLACRPNKSNQVPQNSENKPRAYVFQRPFLSSLCIDVPPPSGKIGRGDVSCLPFIKKSGNFGWEFSFGK